MALTQVQGGMLAGSTNTTTTIQSNGTTAITIDSSQNVGIGTSSPSQKLDVAGDTRVSNSTGNKRFYIGQATPSANDGGSLEFQNSSTQINWAIRTNFNVAGALEFCPSSAAGGVSYTTPSMIVTNAGNVGIGVTNAGNKLVLPNNQYLAFQNSTGGETAYIGMTSGNLLNFSDKMAITSGGDVLIGKTSQTNTGKLEIDYSRATHAGTSYNETSSSSTCTHIAFQRGGTGVGSISSPNNSSVAYNTSSDYRLKENIAPMTGALATVAALKPVTYNWKVDGSSGQGFIAHELQEVCPDAVTGEKDAVETYTDEDGNEQTRIKPQGIDTSFLVATLTAAIQELKAELDATKAEVAALKAAP